MKLMDHLTKDKIEMFDRLRNAPRKKPRARKRNKKNLNINLSRREIVELMGINRDTYRRKNGAWRRK